MTDQKIDQLAREIIENNIPHSIKDKRTREFLVCMRENQYVRVIKAILRTHCIVSREKLKKYDIAHRANSNSWVMLSKEDISDIFGSDLFEKGGGK